MILLFASLLTWAGILPAHDPTLDLSQLTVSVHGQTNYFKTLPDNKPIFIVPFFSSCRTICPRMIATLQKIDSAFPAPKPYTLLLLSFDPKDTPTKMTAWAEHLLLLEGTTDQERVHQQAILRSFFDRLEYPLMRIAERDYAHQATLFVFNHGLWMATIVADTQNGFSIQDINKALTMAQQSMLLKKILHPETIALVGLVGMSTTLLYLALRKRTSPPTKPQ